MDFMERIKDKVNTLPNLNGFKCSLGYVNADESLSLAPVAGSRVIQEFFDNEKLQQLNYNFVVKTKDQLKADATLWVISDFIEGLTELASDNDTFEFESIQLNDKPFLTGMDEKGFYIYTIAFNAKLLTKGV